MQAGPGNFAAAWTDDEVEHLSAMYWSNPRPSTVFMAAEMGRSVLCPTSKTLFRHWWARQFVAVGQGFQEGDEGIFFLVRQFQVAELSFVEIG